MRITIDYAGCCLTGLVRVNNEDNYYCAGQYLPMVHGDVPAFTGTIPPGRASAFAVFDGMGGEERGEAASFLAAEEFARGVQCAAGSAVYLEETALCRQMNRRVLTYAKEHHVSGCGSTAVTLCFDTEDIHGFNLGDSRCYRYSGGKLTAMSKDHAVTSPVTRRSRLTQCLGIPEGLTIAVNPLKIESVLSEKAPLPGKLEALRELVFQRGAEDNVTMILFEIILEET